MTHVPFPHFLGHQLETHGVEVGGKRSPWEGDQGWGRSSDELGFLRTWIVKTVLLDAWIF